MAQPRFTQFQIVVDDIEAVFSSATSDAIDLLGTTVVGLTFDAGETAATVGLMRCDTADGTYRDVYTSSGSLFSVPVVNGYIGFDAINTVGLRFIKLKANAQPSGVVKLAVRPV